ncbi:unnamed protein product [Clonostachys rosea]|uniref:F-box domain-containing protein n=1 Tax=Bionectria ochroleuca TaxID=29856 RepID=A0ABY6UN06_BIOOC|nr:unnamed protein product [Clonostachys rosea]
MSSVPSSAVVTTGLASLPLEILAAILEDGHLSLDDIAAFRLTCRSLAEPAAAILFQRIIISPLRQDRSSFESICRAPHLARHVREVEWSELAWFDGYFALFLLPHDPQSIRYIAMAWEKIPRLDDTVALLDRVCADAFWLPALVRNDGADPTPGPRSDDFLNRAEAMKEFLPIFYELLGLLPHLHTMASRPMNSERIIQSTEYPVPVRHIQAHMPPWPNSTWRQSSDGLFLFVLPAMALLPNPVRRLVWQDELHGNSLLRTPLPNAFTRLDTISISLSEFFIFSSAESDTNFAGLKACLQACNNVRYLSLGIEDECQLGPQFQYRGASTTLLRYSPNTGRSDWTRLISLNLTSMIVEDQVLIAVVKENADTLRHLYLQECNMTLGRLKDLSRIPGLRLQSAQILSEHPQHQCHRMPQEKLLEYLNHQTIPEGEDVQMCSYLDESLQLFPDESPDIAEISLQYSNYPARMFDDDCPEFFMDTLIMTLPMVLIGGAAFDDDNIDLEKLAENTGDMGDGDCVSVADSDDSVIQRIRNGPKWIWNRCCDNSRQIYFTQVPDSHPDGLPTVVWKFTNRRGVVCTGVDPWEVFEEWNPEEGDVEEPLPYSPEMDRAIQSQSVNHTPLPEGAVLYDPEEASRAQALARDQVAPH